VREPAPVITWLNGEQIAEQLHILEGDPTLRAIVATLIYAGLRREEALWLTTDDVDLEQRLIQVRAKNIGGAFWQPKTKRNRAVPISSTLHELLAEYSPERAGQVPGSSLPREANAGTQITFLRSYER